MGSPIGDCPRRPEATRGNAASSFLLWSRRSACQREAPPTNPGEENALGPSRRVPHDEISPKCHRQRLDPPAYIRQRIDDLYRTLITADAKRHRSDVPTGPGHATRRRVDLTVRSEPAARGVIDPVPSPTAALIGSRLNPVFLAPHAVRRHSFVEGRHEEQHVLGFGAYSAKLTAPGQ